MCARKKWQLIHSIVFSQWCIKSTKSLHARHLNLWDLGKLMSCLAQNRVMYYPSFTIGTIHRQHMEANILWIRLQRRITTLWSMAAGVADALPQSSTRHG